MKRVYSTPVLESSNDNTLEGVFAYWGDWGLPNGNDFKGNNGGYGKGKDNGKGNNKGNNTVGTTTSGGYFSQFAWHAN